MRTGMIILALALVAGCDDDNGGSADLSMGADMSAVEVDMTGGGGGDLANVPDGGTISVDAGGSGATCMTACDCMPGLGCFNGTCMMGAKAIYCCNSAVCPAGNLCQSNGGNYGMCNGPGGMPDLAGFDYCSVIHCPTAGMNNTCVNVGCTMCVAGTNGNVCAK